MDKILSISLPCASSVIILWPKERCTCWRPSSSSSSSPAASLPRPCCSCGCCGDLRQNPTTSLPSRSRGAAGAATCQVGSAAVALLFAGHRGARTIPPQWWVPRSQLDVSLRLGGSYRGENISRQWAILTRGPRRQRGELGRTCLAPCQPGEFPFWSSRSRAAAPITTSSRTTASTDLSQPRRPSRATIY